MSFNKVTVVGNLGKDPELRYTPQGIAVCNISLATNEKKKLADGSYGEIVTWFRIILWRQQAENAAKYLTKGSPVYIEGRLRVEEWQDRDGKDRYTLEVNANELQFLGGGSQKQNQEEQSEDNESIDSKMAQQYSVSKTAPAIDLDDDIPF